MTPTLRGRAVATVTLVAWCISAGVLYAGYICGEGCTGAIEGPLIGLAVVLAYVPVVPIVKWGHRPESVGTWHFGKVLILWALLVAGARWAFSIDEGLLLIVLSAAGCPLLVITWTWLTARERQGGAGAA